MCGMCLRKGLHECGLLCLRACMRLRTLACKCVQVRASASACRVGASVCACGQAQAHPRTLHSTRHHMQRSVCAARLPGGRETKTGLGASSLEGVRVAAAGGVLLRGGAEGIVVVLLLRVLRGRGGSARATL